MFTDTNELGQSKSLLESQKIVYGLDRRLDTTELEPVGKVSHTPRKRSKIGGNPDEVILSDGRVLLSEQEELMF